MIECPSCGRKHRPGTLFCAECGVYLATGSHSGTEPIPRRDAPTGMPPEWDAGSGRRERIRGDTVLRITVLSTGRQIELYGGADLQIGRMDAAHEIFPNIDLTPDGGLEAGVSRRHCRLYTEEGEYFVEDLGSANGTIVDGERLPPYLPHVVKDGDRLRLGRIDLEIGIGS